MQEILLWIKLKRVEFCGLKIMLSFCYQFKIMKKIFYLFIATIFAISSCKTGDKTDDSTTKLSEDPHSYANINAVRMNHLSLDLTVNFDKKILHGNATIAIDNLDKSKELILDTRNLLISEVILDNGKAAKYELAEDVEHFGQALTISIEPNTKSVTVFYETSPNAEALQWLSPEQTLDKKHPFLFSQSQAILARTWIPCQDGPGVKFTYDATIRTSPDLIALMSAENGTEKSADGVYTFKMEQPVSSYLMALAVGDLEFKSTGRNSGVYAEPSMLDKCVWEFESMQSMIDSAEAFGLVS